MKNVNENFNSLTKNQKLVLDCLKQARRPLGAYTLLESLQKKGIKAPLQVYRTLNQLADKGMIHKIESLNAWTICCDSKHEETPIFVICKDCGDVKEHLDKQFSKSLYRIPTDQGFKPDHSVVEIYGQCGNCS
jgi:Fur family zinc uptake transcriptional regulator